MQGIEIKGLTLAYDGAPIIEDMSLSIPKGKVTVIIGANGCGKSTLLKSISRILKPVTGTIVLDGMDVHKTPSKLLAQRMAVLPQSPKAPEGLTVAELVAYGRFPYKKGFGNLNTEDYAIIDETLKACGLEAFRDRPVEALSGGQRQRAWIAMTICQRTEHLLLDEPTTYLDLSHQMDILSLLARFNKEEGRTVVMVLHELNNASRFADHMVGMKDGKVIAQGPPAAVMTNENLRRIFGIDAEIMEDVKTHKPIYLSYENVVQ